MRDAVVAVHAQKPGGRSANRRFPEDASLLNVKMILPSIASRMKQRSDEVAIGIDRSEVGALRGIAVRAGQRKVVQIIAAAMSPGDNVIDMEREKKPTLFRTAVFAGVPGPFSNLLADS